MSYIIVNIGNNNTGGLKTSSNNVDPTIWKCPSVINKTNWEGCNPRCSWQYPDRFQITQQGNKVYARRLDAYNGGWGMNLRFKCPRNANCKSKQEYDRVNGLANAAAVNFNSSQSKYRNAASNLQSLLGTLQQQLNELKQSLERILQDKNASNNYNLEQLRKKIKETEDDLNRLQSRYDRLQTNYNNTLDEITRLATELDKVRSDSQEAIRLLKKQIEDKKNEIYQIILEITEQAEILKQEQFKLKIELDKLQRKSNELSELNEDYTKQEGKIDTEIGNKVTVTNDLEEIRQRELESDERFNELERKFSEIEAEIKSYTKTGEFDFSGLIKLLEQKKKIMEEIIYYKDYKYKLGTKLINEKINARSPYIMFKKNQNKEINKNIEKTDKIKIDLSSLGRDIQIKDNVFRKRNYYIFLLKMTMITIILFVIIKLSGMFNYLSSFMVKTLYILLSISVIILFIVNYLTNFRRNANYFNKMDWNLNEEILSNKKAKKCEKK